MGVILLVFWLLFWIFGRSWIYSVHTKWFKMTEQQFTIIHYCGMGLLKLFIFIFFLLPYIACRLCAQP
jgi:hypothetical protein